MKEIILIGGGGHCKSVVDVIEQESQFVIAGIVEKPELFGKKILGYPVIGNDSDLESLAKKYTFANVTVGQIRSPDVRIKLFDLAKQAGFILPKIVYPSAYVSQHAVMGEGTVIMHDALINSGVTIDCNCIINSKALIEHDCKISKNCHISTNVLVNGNVNIEEECFIGSGAVINNSITIKKNSFIKAGSLVK